MASPTDKRKARSTSFFGTVVRDPFAASLLKNAPHPASSPVAARQQRAKSIAPPTEPPGTPTSGFGVLMPFATAGTLLAENKIERMRGATQGPKIGLGYVQSRMGILGMGYYGYKFSQSGDVRDLAATMGYGAFWAHGLTRMAESGQHHAPYTGATGASAAFLKTIAAPGAAKLPYLLDGFANLAEYFHGTHHGHQAHGPQSPVKQVRNQAAQFFHSVKPFHLMNLRAGAAVGFSLYGAYKLYKGSKGSIDKKPR